MQVLGIEIIIILINFLVLYFLAKRLSGFGSDSIVYEYYINKIKKDKNKFFSHLDEVAGAPIMTDPQFFLKMISFFGERQLRIIKLLLNPICISLLFIINFFLFNEALFGINSVGADYTLLALLLCVLNPQYFYGNNARLFGLGNRGIGLVLFGTVVACCAGINASSFFSTYFFIALIAGYLIWGSSLFAQQALVLFGLIMAIFFQSFSMVFIAILSLLIFILLHPRYAVNFLKARTNYFIIFAKHLSPIYILKYRYSVWRDWVYDFWNSKHKSMNSRLSYIYSNPLFVLVGINLVNILIAYFYFLQPDIKTYVQSSITLSFGMKIYFSSLIIFFITSFRQTRFLGEPERYVEIVIPITSILLAAMLTKFGNNPIIIGLLVIVFFLNVSQIYMFAVFLRSMKKNPLEVTDQITAVIKTHSDVVKKKVFFASNNFDLAKYYLLNNWEVAWYYPTAFIYAGMQLEEIFVTFPFVQEGRTMRRIIDYYHINYYLEDKAVSKQSLLDISEQENLLFENENYKVFYLA